MKYHVQSYKIFEGLDNGHSITNDAIIDFLKGFLEFQSNSNGAVFPIYRGMRTNRLKEIDNVLYYGVAPENRTSLNTSKKHNFYNLVIDEHVQWKDFPKRSKSFICTNNFYNSTSYGDPYCVIPINYETVNMGVAKEPDIWFSFDNSYANEYGDISVAHDDLALLINVLRFGDEESKFTEYFKNHEQMIKACDYIDKKISSLPEPTIKKHNLQTIVKLILDAGSALNFINTIASPDSFRNGRYAQIKKIIDTFTYRGKKAPSNEIWFSDNIVAIKLKKEIYDFSSFLQQTIDDKIKA